MTGVQKAIVPGIVFSSLLLVLMNQLVFPGKTVNAATEVPEVVQGISTEQPGEKGCEFMARYPEKIQPWCALIEEQAGEYGVDPLLVAAVMLMESGGNPLAYSLALVAAVCWALYSNLTRRWAGDHEDGAVAVFLALWIVLAADPIRYLSGRSSGGHRSWKQTLDFVQHNDQRLMVVQ